MRPGPNSAAVQPYRSGRGKERLRALREEPGHDAQHIACRLRLPQVKDRSGWRGFRGTSPEALRSLSPAAAQSSTPRSRRVFKFKACHRLHSGHPLDDRDRWPWLEKVADWIDGWRQVGTSGVIACSAAQAQLPRLPNQRATGGARRLFARRQDSDCRTAGRAPRAFHADKPSRQPVCNPGGARPRRGSDPRRR
jgi:hypothetical protein